MKKQSQQEETLRSIQPDAKNPTQILSIESLNLSKDQVKQLMSGNILFQSGRNFFFLNYGLVEHFALQRIGNSLYALKLQQGILMEDIIYESTKWVSHVILTWLFSRNIGRIKKLTQAYSQRDFGYHIKFNKFSTLYSVFKNVVAMGDNLESLIKFQQNITRFVAQYSISNLKRG